MSNLHCANVLHTIWKIKIYSSNSRYNHSVNTYIAKYKYFIKYYIMKYILYTIYNIYMCSLKYCTLKSKTSKEKFSDQII